MIILIFVASLVAFYSREAVGKVISVIYLFATVVISYLVHLYFELGVIAKQLPWPYELNADIATNSDEVLNTILFQKSEASFVLLVVASIVAIYFYLKLSKLDSANKLQNSIIIRS